ncbi:MAG: sugar phosphate isomerase/epimerase [Clostridia bacterium]|nr:sugar phosphate isomerase/epimerase [Clostridia bacterium]
MEDLRIFAFADEADPNFDGQIDAMLRNDLQGIEIRNVDGENIGDISLDKARELRHRLDDAGLITWSIGSPIGKIHIETDDFEAHKETFKRQLEIAHILGAENLRMFSFYMPKDKDPAIYKNEVIDRLGVLTNLAIGSGVLLCHENEKGIYGDNAARCLEILEAVPLLRAVFDPANFVQCGQDTIEAWELLKPYVKYMHIKDAKHDGSVVPAGLGDGNLSYLLAEYRLQGGREFTMEPHLSEFVGLGVLEREGEKSQVGEFGYATQAAAFDAGVAAFRAIVG